MDPVIAGGFARWLYDLSKKTIIEINSIISAVESAKKLSDLHEMMKSEEREVADQKKFYLIRSIRAPRESSYPDAMSKYGDVDLWFLSDSKIYNKDNRFYPFMDSEADIKVLDQLSRDVGYSNVCYRSSWALTIDRHISPFSRKETLQIITRKFDTIKDILDSFDLNLCKIAFYRGQFHIHDDYLAYENGADIDVQPNKWLSSKPIEKMKTAERAFKYFYRTGRPLSKSLTNNIFEIFKFIITIDDDAVREEKLKVQKARKHAQNLNNINTISMGAAVTQPLTMVVPTSYYEKVEESKEEIALRRQKNMLIEQIQTLLIQPNFDEKLLVFLLGAIDKSAQKSIMSAIKISRGQVPAKPETFTLKDAFGMFQI